jgi:hypothetical protein
MTDKADPRHLVAMSILDKDWKLAFHTAWVTGVSIAICGATGDGKRFDMRVTRQ